MVRSPVITYPSPSARIAVLVKVRSPPTSGSKKSAERRWPSRCSLLVVIEAARMVTAMVDSSGSVVVVIRPSNSVNGAVHLAHQVPGGEADGGVRRVQAPGAGHAGRYR